MKPTVRRVSDNAEHQVRTFIAKFDAANQKLIKACRKSLRKRFPSANELVYDNYNFFVIGYCPTERPTDSIVSLAAGASGVGLAFPYCGTKLRDPHKILQGSGSQNRFIRLPSADILTRPQVQDLIEQAEGLCKSSAKGIKRRVIIRSVSAKQRPRR